MNMRLTPKRKEILKALQKHSGLVSAAELHAKLPDMDLATVYRNLELFTKEKMITKVNLGGEEALYELQDEPHHHAICADCHSVIHFQAPDEKIKKLLGLEDFEIESMEVTVRGVCKHPPKKKGK